MQRGLYAAGTGMATATQWMDVIANNLANTNTTGFKKDVMVFNDGLEAATRRQSGLGNDLGQVGAGPISKGVFTEWAVGNLMNTHNPMDFAIGTPEGLFAFQGIDGVQYTRDGAFSRNDQGLLVTKRGFPVLSRDGSPIEVPEGIFNVGEGGEISVNGKTTAVIGIFTGNFYKNGSDQYSCPDAKVMAQEKVNIRQQTIETSNVNAVEEMIAMIRLNRTFEMAQKSAQSEDEANEKLIQTLQSR